MDIHDNFSYCKIFTNRYLNFENEKVKNESKFLFCWPYTWTTDDTTSVRQSAINEVITWISSGAKTSQSKHEPLCRHITDGFLYCTPFPKNTADPKAFQKNVLVSKFLSVLTIIDDMVENSPSHLLPEKLSRTVEQIFKFQFQNVEELEESNLYKETILMKPECAHFLACFQKIREELEGKFGLDEKKSSAFARQAKYFYQLQSWCGSQNNSHTFNTELHSRTRLITSGANASLELIFIIGEVFISHEVRENFFWRRLFEIACLMNSRINDFISIEKELALQNNEGKFQDNSVLAYMVVDKCDFKCAQGRAIREHDEAVKEFRDLVKYLINNPSMLCDLSEHDKNMFFKSMEILRAWVAGVPQGYISMERYGSWQVTFESSSNSN